MCQRLIQFQRNALKLCRYFEGLSKQHVELVTDSSVVDGLQLVKNFIFIRLEIAIARKQTVCLRIIIGITGGRLVSVSQFAIGDDLLVCNVQVVSPTEYRTIL